MAWTSPRTWAAGEVLTGALLNTHVRDNFRTIGDAWTAYGTSTTILTAATTNPTLGAGSSAAAYYLLAGKLCHWRIQVVCGSSGVAAGSGTYQFLLPTAPVAGLLSPLGIGRIHDSGGTGNNGTVMWSSGTTAHLFLAGGLGVTNSGTGAAATNRRYILSGTYEAA